MPKPQTITWVLVADGTRARILTRDGEQGRLHPALAEDFIAPNLPSREIASDRPGRLHAGPGAARHAIDPKADAHRFEKTEFARTVARRLDQAAAAGAFDRLILVAPPQTLGDLRSALGDEVRRRIASELAKDLTHLAEGEITERLGEAQTV